MCRESADFRDARRPADGRFSRSVCFLTRAPVSPVQNIRLWAVFLDKDRLFLTGPKTCPIVYQTRAVPRAPLRRPAVCSIDWKTLSRFESYRSRARRWGLLLFTLRLGATLSGNDRDDERFLTVKLSFDSHVAGARTRALEASIRASSTLDRGHALLRAGSPSNAV